MDKYYLKLKPDTLGPGCWWVMERRKFWFDRKCAEYSMFVYDHTYSKYGEAYKRAKKTLEELNDSR